MCKVCPCERIPERTRTLQRVMLEVTPDCDDRESLRPYDLQLTRYDERRPAPGGARTVAGDAARGVGGVDEVGGNMMTGSCGAVLVRVVAFG
jgi:hypothetical protein